MSRIADGARASPNIWRYPDVYELENRAMDPAGVLEETMREVRSWQGADVVDVGCGTGFHLPRFARDASSVVGIEPHGDLMTWARLRCRGLRNVKVLAGAAQKLPLPPACADIAYARWAYFFGPGCEPGLRELHRIVRRGGVGFIFDNDATRSTFGRWFARASQAYDADAVDDFFSRHGWSCIRRTVRWRFDDRAAFEAVVGIEFAPEHASRIIAEHDGCEVDYAVTVRVRHF